MSPIRRLSTTAGEINSANDMGYLNQTNCWLAAPLDMGGFFGGTVRFLHKNAK